MIIVNIILSCVVLVLLVVISIMHIVAHREYEEIVIWKKISETDSKWISNLQSGCYLERFFVANNIHTIAILNYNVYTYLIFNELSSTDVNVLFCIDDEMSKYPTQYPGLQICEFDQFDLRKNEIDAVIDVRAYDAGRFNCSQYWSRVKDIYKGPMLDMDSLLYFVGEI